MMSVAQDSFDLAVLGAGPAGTSAALMAASLGMRVALVDGADPCWKLQFIGSPKNVPGFRGTGAELAQKLRNQIADEPLVTVIDDARISEVRPEAEEISLLQQGDAVVRAHALVVATGVRPRDISDVNWVTGARDENLPSLWYARPEDYKDKTILVLGADRPVGTVLRSPESANTKVELIYDAVDAYKIAEVAGDPRVEAHLTTSVRLHHDSAGLSVQVDLLDGAPGPTLRGDEVFINLGSAPVRIEGLDYADSGYPAPAQRVPNVYFAGDARGEKFQRVATAWGTGAEAALSVFYKQANQS